MFLRILAGLQRGRRQSLFRAHDVFLRMVGEAGIEPTTPGLEGRCSIQLSYSPKDSTTYGNFLRI